jgi:hypothetical protein
LQFFNCIPFQRKDPPLFNPEILDLIERFQTIFVGVVGFVGVIWTLRANARNTRAEHQQRLKTKQTTLRRILAAEFRNYSRALRSNLKANAPPNDPFSVGRIRRILSESLSADLGLLEPDEIDVVVNAIISLDGMDHFLENLSTEHSETRFIVPATAWSEYRKAAESTADALDFGIQVLELSSDFYD